MRIRSVDEVDILSKVIGVFAKHNINIDKILQSDKTQENYDVIVFTSNIKDDSIDSFKEELKKINADLITVIPILGE